MPAILRNDDAEALILDIRTGRTAARQHPAGGPGAYLLFSTSVVMPGAASGHLVFPLRCTVEPGSLVTAAGSAEVEATVAGVTVRGDFHWSLGGGPPPPASYRFRRRGREISPPGWAGQLPVSQDLNALAPKSLARQQSRLRRRAHASEHWLLTLSEALVRHSCSVGVHRALRYRPAVDIDDVVQRSLQAACRLLPVYASPNRPPCSWLGMLRLDGRRDLHREVIHLDWLPPNAVAALALADACGVDLASDRGGSWDDVVDTAGRLGRPVPRIGAGRLRDAIRGPALLAHEILATAEAGGLATGHRETAPVTATVAGLVTRNADLIARAGAGDSDAIRRVGEQVVRRLSSPRPADSQLRERVWNEFRETGQLFTTPVGQLRFGNSADLDTLTAIDACLCRAAGVRPAAAAP